MFAMGRDFSRFFGKGRDYPKNARADDEI